MMHKYRGSVSPLAAGAFACLASAAVAFEGPAETIIIEVNPRLKELRNVTKGRTSQLDDVSGLTLRRDESVSIRIAPHNPFLFTYEATTTREDTDDFKEALKLARALEQVIKAFGLKPDDSTLGGAEPTAPRLVEGHDFETSLKVLEDLYRLGDKERLGALIDKLSGDDSQRAEAVGEIRAWDLETMEKQVGESFEAASRVARKCVAGLPLEIKRGEIRSTAKCSDKMQEGAADSVSIASYVTLLIVQRDDIEKSLELLGGFKATAVSTLEPRRMGTWRYSLQRQTVTIAVAASTRFESLLSDAARKARTGGVRTIAIVLTPHQPAQISVGPAVVLGFVKDPEFSVVAEGEAFRIKREDPDASAYRVAAMMNITPRAWAEPTFGGFFQIGVSPQKNATAFYVGGGIRTQTLLTFGAGFVWQQVKKLAPGLSIDRTIEKPDLLKTDSEFKPGFYLHLTARIP